MTATMYPPTRQSGCDAIVTEYPDYWHDHPCERRGVVVVEWHGTTRYLCKQHDATFRRNRTGCAFSWRWE